MVRFGTRYSSSLVVLIYANMFDEDEPKSKAPLILVIIVALVVAGFFLLKNVHLNQSTSAVLKSFDPITHQPVSFDLQVTNPDDQSLLFDKSLLVSGKTSSKAKIIISDDGDDTEVDADQDGNFSQSITLDSGLNHLVIAAFADNGDSKQVVRTIYYSQDQLQ